MVFVGLRRCAAYPAYGGFVVDIAQRLVKLMQKLGVASLVEKDYCECDRNQGAVKLEGPGQYCCRRSKVGKCESRVECMYI